MSSVNQSSKSIMVQSFNIKTPNDAQQFYNTIAKDYDSIINKVCYNGATKAAHIFSEIQLDKDAQILDFCAGTGILGSQMHALGFTNLDAHDGSSEMLNIAKSLGIYNKTFCELLQIDVEPKLLPLQTYDALVTSGSFCPGNLSADYLYALPRLVKPGGLIMIATRKSWIDKDHDQINNSTQINCWSYNFRQTLESIMKEKSVELVKEETYPDYCDGKEGICFILKCL